MLSMMFLLLVAFEDDKAFSKAEKEWRATRAENMKKETSWLTVVGLFWLDDGENTFGTGERAKFVLPKHSTVEVAGSFFLEDGKVRYVMNRGQRAVVDEKSTREGTLEPGQILAHNHLRMFVIERGGKHAVRVRDLRTEGFRKFEKLDFFRAREKYVVEASFEPYETPETLTIPTVINTEIEMLVPGKLRFSMKGKEYELLPTLTTLEDEEYFIMFKDKTAGDSTYGGGRFMYVPRPVDGKVTLNFNRAYNPPCAYTDFATCPIPPEENQLEVRLEAGERKFAREGAEH